MLLCIAGGGGAGAGSACLGTSQHEQRQRQTSPKHGRTLHAARRGHTPSIARAAARPGHRPARSGCCREAPGPPPQHQRRPRRLCPCPLPGPLLVLPKGTFVRRVRVVQVRYTCLYFAIVIAKGVLAWHASKHPGPSVPGIRVAGEGGAHMCRALHCAGCPPKAARSLGTPLSVALSAAGIISERLSRAFCRHSAKLARQKCKYLADGRANLGIPDQGVAGGWGGGGQHTHTHTHAHARARWSTVHCQWSHCSSTPAYC